jgi:alpha-galactosidase
MRRRFILLAGFILGVGLTAGAREPARLAEAGDAFVDGDRAAGRWTIGSGLVQLELSAPAGGELRLTALRWPDGPNLARSAHADALITVGERSGSLGSAASGFVVTGVEASAGEVLVELAVSFRQERGPLLATRRYRARPGSAAVEVWTDVRGSGGSASIRDLNALAVTVPEGRVHWVSGLDVGGRPFTRLGRELAPGESLALGSPIVSSTHDVPFVAVAGPEGTVFAALAWSGTWSGVLDRRDDGIALHMGLPAMSVDVPADEVIEGPHALIGVAPGDEHAASSAMQQALMAGRAEFPSLSTFNSWFVYGTRINESNMRDAIEQASRVGIELFQLDAGWYPQERPASIWDFTEGLGTWQVDRSRFPRGLGPIGDHARAHGMRFGVWVEPERVARGTVGQPGLAEERFLATSGGAYDPNRPHDDTPDAQICLGDRAAREWLLARLVAFIEEARPDYLKWDFNRWIVCDRPDHDHAVDGGSFAHGLYAMLEAIRQRFPSLLIENCSGGGHRLDAGLARLTDAGWMDDLSAPSVRVRHNLQGLTALFPAGYLLSYVMPHADEPMNGAADMAALARSRMAGTLGLAVDFHGIGERDINELTQQVRLARGLREYQAGASTYLLTPQAGAGPSWDVVQQWSAARGRGVLWVFNTDDGGARTTVRLRGLDPGRIYELRQVDTNRRELLGGATLLEAGLELRPAQETAGQIYTIEAVGGGPLRVR